MLKSNRKTRFILSALLMVFLITGFQKNDALAKTDHSVSEIMDLTGILRDENGSAIIHNKYATRAEFARMLIQASEHTVKANQTNHLKLFKDIPQDSKYSSYIQIAVTHSYMNGYLNGNFKPNKPVTLKEAVYGILTLLGYTKDDFTGQLSAGRINKYNELGLNNNLNLDSKDKLSKSDCETLFYNLLHAKQKTGDFYGKSKGYSYDTNNVIDYEALFIAKTKGPVITKSGWNDILSKKLSKYKILQEGKVISASNIVDNSLAYYAEQANTIWIFNRKIYGTVESITFSQGEPQDITISGNTYVVENPSNMKKLLKTNNIKKGSLVVLFGRNDKVSYIVPIQSTLASSNWQKQLTFSLSKGTVLINNTRLSVDNIASEDVIYYANELNTVWVFQQKIFGSLNDITLNNGDPEALNISGKSYSIENATKIKERLKSTSLQTKMPVVLLLGWDNKVYDIFSLSSTVAYGNWQQNLSFQLDQGIIYKAGSVIAKNDIHSYDVVYYSNELKTLWVYDNKVYGLFKSISPSSSSPESIVVAGKTYTFDLPPINASLTSSDGASNLSENAWGKRLRTNGVHEGVNVVLLFGFNGYMADILPIEKMPVTIAGYVLRVENQVVKDSNQTSSIKSILHIVDTEGILREYPCSDTTIQSGMLIEISFRSGQPMFQKMNSDSGFKIPSDITTKKFASSANIIDVEIQNYVKLTTVQLSDIQWTSANVLYYKLDTAGNITDLILRQASNYYYQYGILKSIIFNTNEDGSNGMQYVINFGDTESTLFDMTPRWNLALVPKAVLTENNQVQEMHNLGEVPITYISNMQANTGDAVYWISDNVIVYFYKNGTYYTGSLSDITNFSNRTIKGYRDTRGPIRIIVVTN